MSEGYLALEEYKGRAPIVDDGLTLQVTRREF